jgi:hypothetical protein
MTHAIAAASNRLHNLLQLLVLSIRAQWIYFVVPALFMVTNAALFVTLDKHGVAPIRAIISDLVLFTVPAGLLVLLVVRLIYYAAVEKPVSPAKALWRDLKSAFKHPSHIINVLPVFAAMVLFNKAMFELKPAIPKLNPFSWDLALIKLDRVLHFGFDPWVLLQPILGHDYVTFLLSCIYNFWFLALFGSWMWFGFQARATELRTRFFLTYMLIWWMGGGLMALAFSSAGPAYYGLLGNSPDPFAALMAYHYDTNSRITLHFLKAQELLWSGYTGKIAAIGISAFPSVHNASSALFALAFWKVNRKMGWVCITYCGLICVASVHLGWHYAIDAYAGIIIAIVLWKLMAPVARWYTNLAATRKLNDGLAAI